MVDPLEKADKTLQKNDQFIAKLSYIKSINTLLKSQIENDFPPISEAIGHEQAIAILDSIRLVRSLVDEISDYIELHF